MSVVATMATTPARAVMAVKALSSLNVPHINKRYLWVNGYRKDIQTELAQVLESLAHVVYSEGNDWADNGKFLFCTMSHDVLADGDVHLTTDDDLSYAPDYVPKLLAGLARHPENSVVSFHGCIPRFPVRSYYLDRQQFRCLEALANDVQVKIPGTGTMAYRVGAVRVDVMHDMPVPYMADIWMAIWAMRQNRDVYALEHPAKWLRDISISWTGTICEQFAKNSPIQNWLVNHWFGPNSYPVGLTDEPGPTEHGMTGPNGLPGERT